MAECKTIQLVPAYDRDYMNAQRAEADFHDDKDFKIADINCKDNGRYCNKSDILKFGDYSQVIIRYNKNTRTTTVKLGHDRNPSG